MKEKILIVEDEVDIAKMLSYNLTKEGYAVVPVSDGTHIINTITREHPALILLDLMLPGISGIEICKTLKNNTKTATIPIIMLTAKAEESDKVIGLELGADDYVTKPFSVRELIARIKALLRRTHEQTTPAEVFTAGDLHIDFAQIKVTVKKKPVELTAKEFELLKSLITAQGRVLSREHLLNTIWGFDHAIDIQTRTVDVHIRTLRKKLLSAAALINTVKNYGYRFETD